MKTKILRAIAHASTLALLASGPVRAEPSQAAIDAVAEGFVGESTPGLGVLVLQNGQPVHMAGYGWADIDGEIPVTPHSIFDLASVSKQMTALAVRAQIEAGLYREDTEIAEFLPEFAGVDSPRPLTVGDLLHHISGLTDYLDWEGYDSDSTNGDVAAWLAGQTLDHAPGQRYEYSNSGYAVLASLVAAADSAPDLAQVLQARVWGPAGMDDTALPDPADADRRVTGYDGTDGDFDTAMDPNVLQGDGNVFSTLADLARYEAALWQGDFLQDTSALFTEGLLDNGSPVRDDSDIGYGYGWQIYSQNGANIAAHTGSWTGTSTYYQRNMTSGITVILLANGEDAELWDLADEIEAAVQ